MSHQSKRIYEFGPYRLDCAERLLWRDGEVVPLQPKVFDLLLALVERRGRLAGKDELMEEVWPDTVVEEANLTNNISILRKTLGANGQQFIETMPKRGYRFVGLVKEAPDRSVEPVVAEPPGVQIAVTTAQEIGLDDQPGAPDRARPKRWPAILTSRWLMALVALIVVGGGFWVTRTLRQPSASVGKMPRSIAVLPFKPLGPSNRDEAMELGMADTLITKLSSLNQLIVRPTSAIRKYTALDQDPLAAGREQEVEAVLDASYHWTGEKIRVTARLIDVRSGSTFWTYECNEYCADIFTAQDIISDKVAVTLAQDLTVEKRKLLAKRYTENAQAFLLCAKGLHILDQNNPATLDTARQYFQQAIDLDPNYALAQIGLGRSYVWMSHLGVFPPREVWPKAKAAAEQALRLDNSLAEAHTAMAETLYYYDLDFEAAEKELQRALDLDPNSALTRSFYASFLKDMGRFDEAFAENQRALSLNPLSYKSKRDRVIFLYQARLYDQAIAECQKVIELDPTSFTIYDWLGAAYAQKGLYDQAVAAYLKSATYGRFGPEIEASLRTAYAVSGWRGYWQTVLDLKKKQAEHGYVRPYIFANIYARLGDKDQAIGWLEKAYVGRDVFMCTLKVEPRFDGLRSDPRFTDLLRRIGFKP